MPTTMVGIESVKTVSMVSFYFLSLPAHSFIVMLMLNFSFYL